MGFNITKQYGPMGKKVWVDHQGSRFCIIPRGCKQAMVRYFELLTVEEATDYAPVKSIDVPETASNEEKAGVLMKKKDELEERLQRLLKKNMGSILNLEARKTACQVIDWEGLTDYAEDGETEVQVPYSIGKSIELFTNYPDFKSFIDNEVDKLDEVREVVQKKARAIKKK